MTAEQCEQYHAELEGMIKRIREMGAIVREEQLASVDAALREAYDALRDAMDRLAWAKG